MLVFALDYRQVIDEISSDRDMRKYELDEEEWELVQQLCDVLGVHCAVAFSFPQAVTVAHVFLVIQGRDPFLFTFNTKPCHCYTCNGSH
jgi:hypothetical protein